MGRISTMKLALGFVLLVVLLPVTAAGSSRTASISFVSTSPVSVRGVGFKSHERVAVTVTTRVLRTKRVTANARGAFRVTFRGFSVPRCQPYAVRAKGNRGSVAAAKLIPECAPPAVGSPKPLHASAPQTKKP